MGKIKDFFKKWWKVMVVSVILLMELSALGCSVYAASRSQFFGVLAIFGSFIAVCSCVYLLIRFIDEAKHTERR